MVLQIILNLTEVNLYLYFEWFNIFVFIKFEELNVLLV